MAPKLTKEPLSDPRSSARAKCRAIGSVGCSRARAATVDGRTHRGRNRRLFRRTPRPGEPRRAPRRRRRPSRVLPGTCPLAYRQNRRRRSCAAAAGAPWQDAPSAPARARSGRGAGYRTQGAAPADRRGQQVRVRDLDALRPGGERGGEEPEPSEVAGGVHALREAARRTGPTSPGASATPSTRMAGGPRGSR